MDFIVFNHPIFDIDALLVFSGGVCERVTCDNFTNQCKIVCGTITCGKLAADIIKF